MQTKLSIEDRLKFLGVIFLILGPILLGLSVKRAFDTGAYADLTARAPIIDAECGPSSGGYVFIVVEGERYACSAGRKCPDDMGDAAYEPGDPSQCRAAVDLGGPGVYEMAAWGGGTVFCLVGLIGMGLMIRQRRRGWA